MTDFTAVDGRLDEWITGHENEIVAAVQALVRIPSVDGPPTPDAPFGAETRRALENVLAVSERYGFRTKMLDGYAAHMDFGEGDELIGVLSHVDVVPAGSDWQHEPFGAQIEDGQIFGRGTIDDKGPTIAALYALIAVKETGAPVRRRMRQIIGANEESGFLCMAHYFNVAREEMPTMGFTPDGRFPCIYAEKGIAGPTLTAPAPRQDGPVRLAKLTAGERSNMVPDRAEARLTGDRDSLAMVRKRLAGADQVGCAEEGTGLVVRATGISAHASTPDEGTNAIKLLTDALLHCSELAAVHPLLKALNLWAADTTGEHLGIAGSEEITGALTSNLGVATFDGDEFAAKFSIRYPVTWTEDDVRSRIEQAAAGLGFQLSAWTHQGPLHVPSDSALITALLEVYRAETGDMQAPMTMGGGTYARVLKNGVAFGPDFPGSPPMAHQADEHWAIADLIKATRIYAKALARLADPSATPAG